MKHGEALRRVAKAMGAYALGGCLLWVSLPGIQRTFLLPELFGATARGAILLGALFAGAVAWRYPHVGGGGSSDSGR